MKKLPPSGYVSAEDSVRPGYLAARMRKYAEAEKEKAARIAANAAEVESKVQALSRKAK